MTTDTLPAKTVTARDLLRGAGVLAVVEGLAFAIGGSQTARLLGQVMPRWFAPWLRGFAAAPTTLCRLYGVAEIVLGLRVLAMTPPTPRLVEDVADLALEPFRAFWRASLASDAERAYGKLLNEVVRPGARVLDLGCGEGDNLARILEEGLALGSYIGLDSSSGALARARARFDGIPKVDFRRNDLDHDQLPTGEFDVILSTWAVDQVADPYGLIVRALRQLRYGGNAVILFTSPVNGWRHVPATLVARFTGRRPRGPDLFAGLPAFTAVESFANGLISMVIFEKPQRASVPNGAPISASGAP